MYNIEELDVKLLSELKDIADQLGISNSKKLQKKELIYKILDQQAITPINQLPEKTPAMSTEKNEDASLKDQKNDPKKRPRKRENVKETEVETSAEEQISEPSSESVFEPYSKTEEDSFSTPPLESELPVELKEERDANRFKRHHYFFACSKSI